MRSFSRSHTALLLVALCAFVRLAFFLAVAPWEARVEREVIVRSDAAGYDLLARNLLDHGHLTAEPETLRTPLYPAFVAAVYAVTGREPWAVLLVQIGLAGLSCGLLYRTTQRILGQRPAVFAGLFFALDPALVFSSVTLMSETLFVLLCLLSFHALVVAIDRRFDASSRWQVAGAGIGFAAAALVRPIALYLPGAVALFLLIAQRRALRSGLQSGVLFVVAFAATLAPWALRNVLATGTFAISSSGAYNLLVLNVVPMEMERRGQPFFTVSEALLAEADAALAADGGDPAEAGGFEKAPYQRALARRYIAERPLTFAKFYAFGVFTSFTNLETRGYADWLGLRNVDDPRFDLRAYPNPFDLVRAALAHKSAAELTIGAVVASFLVVLYACAAWGAVVLQRQTADRERDLLWLCLVLAVYFVALTGVAGLARFKVPALPFLDVLAGVGAAHVHALVRRAWATGAPAPMPSRLPSISR